MSFIKNGVGIIPNWRECIVSSNGKLIIIEEPIIDVSDNITLNIVCYIVFSLMVCWVPYYLGWCTGLK